MKRLHCILLFFLVAISFVSCILQAESKEEISQKDSIRSFSSSYKPPIFLQDDRIEKIKAVAPDIDQLFENYRKENNIPGIAYGIVVDGELVIAAATGNIDLDEERPASSKSAFRIASMTKSFTAMAIIKLRDEGKLSLSDPVAKYVPEVAKLEYLTSDAPTIDIENLLTMTSGFPEDNPWGDRQLEETDQMLIDLIDRGISFSNVPSFTYEYSNTGYAILGRVIAKVSGQPYQNYIRENLLQPLGMNQTYWEYEKVPEDLLVIGYRWEDEQWKLEPMLHDGSFGAMGGLITTIEDFSKYVSFHLSAWPPRSEEDSGPIKRSSLREMQTPQFPRLFASATDQNGEVCPTMAGYGYGLRINKDCHGITWGTHGGALPGFGSNYVFFQKYGVGLMAFCNLTYTTPWPLTEIRKLLFQEEGLQPRILPASAILLERQQQVVELIQHWNEDVDTDTEETILAENFYLDRSREHRIKEVKEILSEAGAIQEVKALAPFNQLRGTFEVQTENGVLDVFFTLSPETVPKVQRLYVSFEGN